MSDDKTKMEPEKEKCHGIGEQGEQRSQSERNARVMNSSGGYVYRTDFETQLKRFLCIGTTGGTYYTGEAELIRENAKCIDRLIDSGNGTTVVELVREFSVQNRACKQRPILYTLALCCRSNDPETKEAGYKALTDVCRIPTHLFEFIKYCKEESAGTGWGRAHRRAVSNWYLNYGKKGEGMRLAHHLTKYKNRFGWRHKDIFRLCHIKPEEEHPEIKYLIMAITRGQKSLKKGEKKKNSEEDMQGEKEENPEVKKIKDFMKAVAQAEKCTNVETMKSLILEHNLTREHVPTDLLKSKEIWKALIKHMPMTAMIRNLGKMSHLDLLESGSFEEELTIQKLTNPELLKNGRIHPFFLLVALNQYKKGHGELGRLKWIPNDKVTEALEDAFYLSFKNVKPTEKRFCLAVDVSGSMNVPVMGTPTISARDAAAAMMMVTARTEQNFEVVAFSGELAPLDKKSTDNIAFSGGLTPLDIKSTDNLDNVLDKCASLPFCGTDCSRPMKYAIKHKKEFDVFIVYTDSETCFGETHPSEALVDYREKLGIPDARLIVCGMASNGFTIADPNDPMMLDIVGFDADAPRAIHEFSKGFIHLQ